MTNLRTRLTALEQTHRHARPPLVMVYRAEQEGRPTEAQAAQIEHAEKQGREVKTISIRRAEDSFPGFTGLPPKRLKGTPLMPRNEIRPINDPVRLIFIRRFYGGVFKVTQRHFGEHKTIANAAAAKKESLCDNGGKPKQ